MNPKIDAAIEIGNSGDSLTKELDSCPRDVANPGLYFGALLGWEAAERHFVGPASCGDPYHDPNSISSQVYNKCPSCGK